jgi:3'-phosphoadenosine 5'-phosphosulfate sulfotransferase (PAPS reductase)/FAD synthetase
MSKLIQADLLTKHNLIIENIFSDLAVLSMGLGQDSHTILFKIVHDPEFRARYAPHKLLVLFADTGNEHPHTYQYMNEVTIPFCKKHNIEFVSITNDMGYHGNTWQSLTGQWESGNPTIGSVAYPKTCTHNLKLIPQYRFVEEYIAKNYPEIVNNNRKKGYVQFAKYYGKIRWLVGIAKGEESRVADAEAETALWKKQAVVVEYPLIDIGFDRTSCQKYINSLNYPLPMPSNCMFCPYGSAGLELLWMYHNYPDRFDEWVALEQKKLDAHPDVEKNLGVSGRLHKSGERKGTAVTLLDALEEAKIKFPNATLEDLQDYKWSHGHCMSSWK